MAKASPALAAFVKGEVSPQCEGRVDQDFYAVAQHIGSNFITLKQGPATFRQGTAYVQQVKSSSQAWLQRFEFSQTQAFVIEFGGGYCRFYTNHGPLLSTGVAAYNSGTAYTIGATVLSAGVQYYCIAATTGHAPPNTTYWYPLTPYNGSTTTAIYEIPSPYAGADLTDSLGEFTLQIQQSGDVLYIAGGYATTALSTGYQPYTLTRYSNSPPQWIFTPYAPPDGPFISPAPLAPNANITLTVSATQGVGITINAHGGNVFASTDVGRLVRIASQIYNVTPWATQTAFTVGAPVSNNGNNYVALNSATTGGSPPVHTTGSVLDGLSGVRWLYTDSGYGIARITGYTSPIQVTATVLSTFPINVVGGGNVAITGITNASPAVVTATNPSWPAGSAVFISGVVGMTQVNGNLYSTVTPSGTTVTLAGVDSTSFGAYVSGGIININASTEWQLGAWSNTSEWPRACAFFKDRLFWAGKYNIWGSVPGEYSSQAQDQFGVQTPDSGINNLVASGDSSPICWLSPAIILLIGTEGGEYGLDAPNYSTAPLGPSNVEILRQSNWRCRHIAPSLVGPTLLYVQRAGRKVFAMDYNFYLNRYDSTDQSKFAYHISIGGITSTAFQQEPWAILWATRSDGTLLSYTFNREDQVTAWNRHNLGNGGICESVTSIPAPDGLRDELWMIVNRTVNGQVIRTVEYMVKQYEGPQAGYVGDAQSSAWYVDCGVQALLSPAFTITSVSSTFNRLTGVGSTTYTAVNTLSIGQTVFINGISYTGTFNPNIQGALVTAASSTQFTIAQNLVLGTFAYQSGGMASVGTQSGQTITGLPPVMYGQTVNILADGSAQPQGVVSNTGTLTLNSTFSVVTVGFPYQGNLVPMRPEGGATVGTAQGKRKQGYNVVIRLVDSYGITMGQLSSQNITTQQYQNPLGSITQSVANPEFVMNNYTGTPLDGPPPLQSGDFLVSFPHQANSSQDESDFFMLVQQNLPLPCTVVGLFPSYSVEEYE